MEILLLIVGALALGGSGQSSAPAGAGGGTAPPKPPPPKPPPQKSANEQVLDTATSAAKGCLKGALIGAPVGAPAGGIGAPVGAGIGCVAGAIIEVFSGGNEEVYSGPFEMDWPSDLARMRDRLGGDPKDQLWVQRVKVSDGQRTQCQEVYFAETWYPPFFDYEIDRRVVPCG